MRLIFRQAWSYNLEVSVNLFSEFSVSCDSCWWPSHQRKQALAPPSLCTCVYCPLFTQKAHQVRGRILHFLEMLWSNSQSPLKYKIYLTPIPIQSKQKPRIYDGYTIQSGLTIMFFSFFGVLYFISQVISWNIFCDILSYYTNFPCNIWPNMEWNLIPPNDSNKFQ